jgi:hypothetical protein
VSELLRERNRLRPRFMDWIWHIEGSLPLAPGQSGDDAFERLDPLFRESGTSHERTGNTLTFTKKDQAAQDKMSIFDGGVLRIEKGVAGAVLHYRMTSRILLFCFLAPLLFLGFAGMTVVVGKLQKPPTEAEKKAEKAKKEKIEKERAARPQNPIDKSLGAPAPEKPKKGDKKDEQDKDKPSPTAAYVFAALFAALYVFGRVIEERLVKALFKKSLVDS